jgi:hypothetical protein
VLLVEPFRRLRLGDQGLDFVVLTLELIAQHLVLWKLIENWLLWPQISPRVSQWDNNITAVFLRFSITWVSSSMRRNRSSRNSVTASISRSLIVINSSDLLPADDDDRLFSQKSNFFGVDSSEVGWFSVVCSSCGPHIHKSRLEIFFSEIDRRIEIHATLGSLEIHVGIKSIPSRNVNRLIDPFLKELGNVKDDRYCVCAVTLFRFSTLPWERTLLGGVNMITISPADGGAIENSIQRFWDAALSGLKWLQLRAVWQQWALPVELKLHCLGWLLVVASCPGVEFMIDIYLFSV